MKATSQKYNSIFSYSRKTHQFLIFCISISILCITLCFLLLFCECFNNFVKTLPTNMLFNIWFSFAKFVSGIFNPFISALLGAIISGLVWFLKGEDRRFYLQLRTFILAIKPRCCIFLVLLLGTSVFLQIYATDMTRYSASALAAVSITSIIILITWYIIRYSNDQSYFQEEQCRVILNSWKKKSKKRFYRYIVIRFPDNPEKYNNILDDVFVLKLLVSSLNISKFDIASNHAHYNYDKLSKEMLRYFDELIIPITAHMIKTHHAQRFELIRLLQKYLEQDFSNTPEFNKYFRFFLMSVSRQFLIEFDDINSNELPENEISSWLIDMEYSFYKLYGQIDTPTIHNAGHYFYEEEIEKLYTKYIAFLSSLNLLQLNAYYIKEISYISKAKILDFNLTSISDRESMCDIIYSPSDVIFADLNPYDNLENNRRYNNDH